MSKFRIYNVQLLPDDQNIDEIGAIGYRKLFSELRDLNKKHLSAKTTTSFHYDMPGDTYIGPDNDFSFPAGFVYGNFIRYTKTERLTDLSSGKTIFKAGEKTAISTKKQIPFVFDTKRHLLAIDGAHLPKGKIFIEALERFLTPICEEHFPNHNLEINIISKINALEEVFEKATAYKTVDIDLAFPNGNETEKLLRELKETKTQLKVHASAGKKGRMSDIPHIIKDMLRAAVSFGTSSISYFVETEPGKERKALYKSEDTPVTFEIRSSPNDKNKKDFYARVSDKLADIDISPDRPQEPSTEPEHVKEIIAK